jgi:hypothetical protein
MKYTVLKIHVAACLPNVSKQKKKKRNGKGANVNFCNNYLAAVMRTIVSYMCSKRIALFSRV